MSGSVVNEVLGSPTRTVPEIGMGATILMYTDREPVTIVEIKHFQSGPRRGQPREVVVQHDKWKVTSGGEHDGSAQYEYEPDPRGRKESYVLSLKGAKAGAWIEKGSGGRGWKLALGRRERYRNPHI